jgi:hypothetical protein
VQIISSEHTGKKQEHPERRRAPRGAVRGNQRRRKYPYAEVGANFAYDGDVIQRFGEKAHRDAQQRGRKRARVPGPIGPYLRAYGVQPGCDIPQLESSVFDSVSTV